MPSLENMYIYMYIHVHAALVAQLVEHWPRNLPTRGSSNVNHCASLFLVLLRTIMLLIIQCIHVMYMHVCTSVSVLCVQVSEDGASVRRPPDRPVPDVFAVDFRRGVRDRSVYTVRHYSHITPHATTPASL